MSERYLRELEVELGEVGIRGSRRRRILAETADHLRESGDPARFGEPRLIAARFADELATNGARRTALFSLFALAPAAIGYALLLGLSRPGPDITSGKTLPLGMAAALVIALAPQISLAAGLLAIALAWRLRAVPVAPAAAISFLHRRAAVALVAGAATLGGVAVYAVEYSRGLPDRWTTLAFAVTATAMVPVAVTAAALGRPRVSRPVPQGPPAMSSTISGRYSTAFRSGCVAGHGASASSSQPLWPWSRSSVAASTKDRATPSPSSPQSVPVLPFSAASSACGSS
jgi:hypothetical protein